MRNVWEQSMQNLPHADLESVSPKNGALIFVEAKVVRAYVCILHYKYAAFAWDENEADKARAQ